MPTGESLLDRTIGCGEVTVEDAAAEREVVLTGWVHRRRDLGQLIFIELRDATGSVQIVFDPSGDAALHAAAEGLRQEFVVGVRGKLVPRESVNPDHPTGRVEVRAEALEVMAEAEPTPFPVDETVEANEEIRLTHRYVDLRRPRLQRALRLRHRLARAARSYLDEAGFNEIETPMLTRSTPEGARDYLVPSRVQRGSFYALPQSPQLFKQLLMIAGFERYYQFARCFRDEDLRADRQPEFTQIDIEMSFVDAERVYRQIEPMMQRMFAVIGVEIELPLERISYAEAMERFGTDRPDRRFGMEIRDPGDAVAGTGFLVFDRALEAGGIVRGIVVPGGAAATRKKLDRWTEWAKAAGAAGLVWIKREAAGKLASPVMKALGEEQTSRLADALGAGEGDAALLVAADRSVTLASLAALRERIAADEGLIPEDRWDMFWVEDFPLFEWDGDAKRHVAIHHPFTAPRWDQLELLEREPGAVVSQAYDLVLNGVEIGGGSVRIHRRDVQRRVFRALGIGDEEAEAKFGFLLRALSVGAPPHAGIALGFDRVCAMLGGHESIRDVIAFPKTTSASCLMTGSPSAVEAGQLKELGLRLR